VHRQLVRRRTGAEDDRGDAEDDRQPRAGGELGLHAAFRVADGRGEARPDVDEPPEVPGRFDRQEVPVEEQVVVDREVALASDREGRVG
jgi:hypothetical protein